nr:ribonuclease H-like domain-containing protein [Tanacetum cinerariifolium]
MASASPICLMARASSTKSWLWHQRLSHLNFDTINDLARNDLVASLPKFKYHKKHLCPSCEQGKSKRASHPPKPVLNSRQRLHLLHMDLCGPMRIASINGKRYVLVIVDDYSRYTWSPVIIIRTDNGTKFKNHVLKEYFNNVGISHQMSFVQTPQQNGVVERRNRRKPDILFLHVFGALCYPKNDREDIGKLGVKGDIGFFIGYSADSCAYRVYKRRTKKIMETMDVSFDEFSAMAFEHRSSKPGLNSMTSGHISSGLDLTYAPSTITTQQPSKGELDLLFEAMYDDYISGQPSATARTVPPAQEPQVRQSSTASTTIADIALILTNSSSLVTNILITSQDETNVVTTAMTAILKQFQATPPPAFVKDVEEICVTCGGAHLYYQCLAADGNTFTEFQDNIQGYVSAAAVNYNQIVPLSELDKIKKMNEINIKATQTQINNVKNELRNEMKTLIQASMSNQTNKLKNMMASFFQMNTASTLGSGPLPSKTISNPKGELKSITTRSGLVLDGPSVPMPPPFINSDTKKMLKALLSYKEKLLELSNTPLNENCSTVILKKLPEKLGDPGKFLIPCGVSELKYKALVDLGASINLIPLSVWKNLGLPELISTSMTLGLANWEICTPAGIARDVFVPVGKFTFLADFVIVDYESDPRVPLILGRPFLRAAHSLIDVYREEMILRDGDERLTLNMRHDTSSYSNQSHKESIIMINIYNDSYEDYLEDLFATNHLSGNPTFSSHADLTSPKVIDPLSGNTTSSSPDHLLESCLMLTLEGFPFITVNTKEYHFECSGDYHRDNA